MPKGRREWGSGDDDLDVIDFLADEGRPTAPEPEGDDDGSKDLRTVRRRRAVDACR